MSCKVSGMREVLVETVSGSAGVSVSIAFLKQTHIPILSLSMFFTVLHRAESVT